VASQASPSDNLCDQPFLQTFPATMGHRRSSPCCPIQCPLNSFTFLCFPYPWVFISPQPGPSCNLFPPTHCICTPSDNLLSLYLPLHCCILHLCIWALCFSGFQRFGIIRMIEITLYHFQVGFICDSCVICIGAYS
jgi:hypothetical protein